MTNTIVEDRCLSCESLCGLVAGTGCHCRPKLEVVEKQDRDVVKSLITDVLRGKIRLGDEFGRR